MSQLYFMFFVVVVCLYLVLSLVISSGESEMICCVIEWDSLTGEHILQLPRLCADGMKQLLFIS